MTETVVLVVIFAMFAVLFIAGSVFHRARRRREDGERLLAGRANRIEVALKARLATGYPVLVLGAVLGACAAVTIITVHDKWHSPKAPVGFVLFVGAGMSLLNIVSQLRRRAGTLVLDAARGTLSIEGPPSPLEIPLDESVQILEVVAAPNRLNPMLRQCMVLEYQGTRIGFWYPLRREEPRLGPLVHTPPIDLAADSSARVIHERLRMTLKLS
ncbi:hypothetical protein LVJ94_48425 [Pendulispora rubella]|uniref:Uncharacterized protein n=1 Tax=Pendulispora rubella TaxID=2741070 RepID=A0ABZ2L554_9BACT